MRGNRFVLFVVAVWGLILVGQGVWNTLKWNQAIWSHFFDPGGPVRVVSGFMWIIVAFTLLTLLDKKH